MSVGHTRVIVTLTCLTLILSLIACSPDSKGDTEIRVGTQARLRGGPEATIVATDQESIRAFAKAKAANDEYGLKELIRGGKILAVPNNTKGTGASTSMTLETRIDDKCKHLHDTF
ncbi:MAG TPA: hypothetical protein VJ464_29340 [Blastocatellia bacterium]|nr:hypothetical protein [Blastocatellia bacterium]